MNALVFLYERLLKQELSGRISAVRASRGAKVSVVPSREEVQRVLAPIDGTAGLIREKCVGRGNEETASVA